MEIWAGVQEGREDADLGMSIKVMAGLHNGKGSEYKMRGKCY